MASAFPLTLKRRAAAGARDGFERLCAAALARVYLDIETVAEQRYPTPPLCADGTTYPPDG